MDIARPELGNASHPGERTLLIAARSGRSVVVRLLLKRASADPNTIDNTGSTPLWSTYDSTHVHVEAVRLLLEAGADPPMARAKDGWTPLACGGRERLHGVGGHVELNGTRRAEPSH